MLEQSIKVRIIGCAAIQIESYFYNKVLGHKHPSISNENFLRCIQLLTARDNKYSDFSVDQITVAKKYH